MPADSLDLVFKAFADRTRLRILNLLSRGETCVGDLVAILKAPQPTVSRHLAYLRRAGLVDCHRQGTWAWYRLSEPESEFHDRLLRCLECCLAEAPQLKRDAQRLERLRARGGCCTRSQTNQLETCACRA